MTATATAGMPLRGDRILRYVTAFCPACHRDDPDRPLAEVPRLAGYLAERDDHVWLVRGCATHGRMETLYDESPEILRWLEQWTAPTRRHVPDHPGNFDPIPSAYSRGLGEMQTQHTCILLEDIIATCNLSCPTCFADSSPHAPGIVPVEDVLANVDARLGRENGRLDVLMLSGGEPTLHPGLLRLLDALLERNIQRILINTNGIQVAKNDVLMEYLAANNTRIEAYLQFDGFRLTTHHAHRGADLRRIKTEAVERLSAGGVFTTLTMTACLGVNDDEIGAILQLALDTPFVGGVSIQPQFASGRSAPIDPMNRLTHTGVLARLGPQTSGLISWKDLTALPCSHPHCCSIGYMLRTDDGQWRSLVGILGEDTVKAHLGLVANRITDAQVTAQLRELVRESLLGMLSEQSSLTHPTMAQLFRNVCEACDLGLSTLLRVAGQAVTGNYGAFRKLVSERIKRITVKPFMDISTMLEERLVQCCVHVGSNAEDRDQCVPFCAIQAWPALTRTKLAERERAAAMNLIEPTSKPAA
jgi:uncharacterized radical SAM superfamily Fe-S cluster-containing enzyme